MASGMEPGLKVRGVKNINNFFFFLTLNKHSFSINKPSTKTNTQKFCFFNTLKCINKHSLHTVDKSQQLIKTH